MEGHQSWIGTSGVSYQFEIWPIATTAFNSVPCNYILASRYGTTWHRRYVGQTNDLKQRMEEHKKVGYYGATHVHVLNKGQSLETRLAIEKDLGGR